MNNHLKQTGADEFDAREYFLRMPEDVAQADDDFDAREWFMANAGEQEAASARLVRLLGEAGFRQLQIRAGAEDGFDFRYEFADPANFTTEQVHDELVRGLEQAGYNPVVVQVALVLANGVTKGTFWLAR